MNFEISEAQPNDANQLYGIQRESWLETYPNIEAGISRQDIEDNFSDTEKGINKWNKWLETPRENVHIWKMGNKEKIIGFCIASKGNMENKLSAIYVLPEYQNKGHGSSLAFKALEWLGNEKGITVEVASYNEQAIKFYNKLGFKYSHVVTDITNGILPNGKFIPQIQMIRTKKV